MNPEDKAVLNEIRRCVRRYNSILPRRRYQARDRIREIGHDAIDALHTMLARKRTGASTLRKSIYIGGALFLVVTITLLILNGRNPSDYWAYPFIFATSAYVFFVFGVWLVSATTINSSTTSVISCLCDIRDSRSLGVLIDTLGQRADLACLPVVHATVAAILANVSRETLTNLSAQRREILYSQLFCDDAPLVIAILTALPFFPDGGALYIVEKLSLGSSLTVSRERVMQLATEVLPAVRTNAEQHRSNTTLLRAASHESSTAETALRAV